jgi:hypothetical protein
MRYRPDQCPLARSLAPGNAYIQERCAVVLGQTYRLPRDVRRFIATFDVDAMPYLVTLRPLRLTASIDHLDFVSTAIPAVRPRKPDRALIASAG